MPATSNDVTSRRPLSWDSTPLDLSSSSNVTARRYVRLRDVYSAAVGGSGTTGVLKLMGSVRVGAPGLPVKDDAGAAIEVMGTGLVIANVTGLVEVWWGVKTTQAVSASIDEEAM